MSSIILTWKSTNVIKEKLDFKYFYYMYAHIVEVPTNKGANSYKLKFKKIRELVLHAGRVDILKLVMHFFLFISYL